jgi:hypothetical protein
MVRALLLSASFVLAFATARTAHAGMCFGPEDNDELIKELEGYAKKKTKEFEEGTRAWYCLPADAVRLRARIERACNAIVARDGIESKCTRLSMIAGIPKLGKHDLYELAVKLPEDPIQWESVEDTTRSIILGRMGDPRGLPVVLELWKTSIPRAEQNEKRRIAMRAWSVWRQGAAEALGQLGGKDEIAFLEEQAKATKDSFVAKACRDAIAAIEKRIAAQATAPAKPAAPAAPPAAPPTAPAAPPTAPAAPPTAPVAPAAPTAPPKPAAPAKP